MSKERELLQRAKILLDCVCTSPVQKEIEELLAQPEQEPVAWQYRTKPNWIEEWNDWENCSKGTYEDYKRFPIMHDWVYETRELYASPPNCELLSDGELKTIAVEEEFLLFCSEDEFIEIARVIEKAHGINGTGQ